MSKDEVLTHIYEVENQVERFRPGFIAKDDVIALLARITSDISKIDTL